MVDQGMKEQACPSGFERLEQFWQLQVSRDSLVTWTIFLRLIIRI